jgi:hypothetical protein
VVLSSSLLLLFVALLLLIAVICWVIGLACYWVVIVVVIRLLVLFFNKLPFTEMKVVIREFAYEVFVGGFRYPATSCILLVGWLVWLVGCGWLVGWLWLVGCGWLVGSIFFDQRKKISILIFIRGDLLV